MGWCGSIILSGYNECLKLVLGSVIPSTTWKGSWNDRTRYR